MQRFSDKLNVIAGDTNSCLKKFFSKKNKYSYTADNIIIGPGSKELMFLLHILFEGDIILPAPSWVSYEPQAILGRNKIQTIQTTRENNWFPTGAEIEQVILKDKKKNYLLFLNSPNNPSGQVCKNLEEISQIAKKYNLIILSDEIYSELSFEEGFKSIANFCPEKTIISTGLSKWCGAGGWRLGYFIIPNTLNILRDAINVLASETFSSVSAPIQYAALGALGADTSKNTEIIESRLEALVKIAKDIGLEFIEPDGAMYLFAKTKYKDFDATKFSEKLLEHGVAIAPGEGFGDYKEFFRITAIDETRLKEGMIILDTVLKESYE